MAKKGWLSFLIKTWAISVLVIVIAIVGLWWFTKPAAPDEFYKTPAQIPAETGQMVNVKPFTGSLPKGARGWRMLYTTKKYDDTIAVASTIVLAPAAPSGLPSNVILWTHGTTGFDPGCAPSVLEAPWANVPGLDEAIKQGWVVTAPDYIGLGTEGPHPYLIGEGQARSALDAVRALKGFKELEVSEKLVVWGHSQGGNAAMWTGMMAKSYAPELTIDGIVAAAPATDLPALVKAAESTPVGKILSAYIVAAYSATYPDVSFDESVSSWKRPIVKDIASRCIAGPKALFAIGESMVAGGSIFAADPTTGPLGERLKQNIPNGTIEAPLMIGQGMSDELVLPDIQGKFVDERCKSGIRLDYKKYPGLDHLTLVAKDSVFETEMIQWTVERFNGNEFVSSCTEAAPQTTANLR